MIVNKWSVFKNFVDIKSLSIQYSELDNRYILIAIDGPFKIEHSMAKNNSADQIDFETNYKSKANNIIAPFINDLPAVSSNRIKAGYSIYVTGIADDISGNVKGGGSKLKFDSTTATIEFQMLNHWYAIGAIACWINCSEDNYFDATLYSPATTPTVEANGGYIVSNGVIVPVGPGAGTHSLDLTAKIGSSDVLACSPVPIAGNTGFFDYDNDTNIITPNFSQKGGYHLLTSNINLHSFGRYIWASPINGTTTDVGATDLVGKLLYNFWKIKIEFKKDGGSLSSEKATVKFLIGAKGNI